MIRLCLFLSCDCDCLVSFTIYVLFSEKLVCLNFLLIFRLVEHQTLDISDVTHQISAQAKSTCDIVHALNVKNMTEHGKLNKNV